MKKETWILVGGALIIGLLAGVLLTKGGGRSVTTSTPPPSMPAPPVVDYQKNINMLTDLVTKEPGNRNAWVQLGNTYFDSDQPIEAVEAYEKALEIDPRDPNVLVDQGVMFRRLGWFDRAIENFRKAIELHPSHMQAFYNLGIVYRYDLQEFEQAKDAWQKYMALNPTGPGADQVRQQLEFLETHPVIPKEQ